MKFIAIGRTEILLESATNLIQNGHDMQLMITCPSEQYQYSKNEKDFLDYCADKDLECIVTNDINSEEIIQKIKLLNPDIGISYNWKTLIKRETIDIFPLGILNSHSGDIPRYKGNAVRNWAIVSGEEYMGLTIHQMSEKLDDGPIVIKKNCKINEATSIKNLYDFVSENTPKLFLDAVNGLEKGTLTPVAPSDNLEDHLRCFPRLPIDSEIDWNLPAKKIEQLIRASSEPFSGAYTFLDYNKLIIWEATVFKPEYNYLATPGQVVERRISKGEVLVSTGSDFLVIKKVSINGGKKITKPTEIIKSIRTRLGLITTSIYDLNLRIEKIENRLKNENNGE